MLESMFYVLLVVSLLFMLLMLKWRSLSFGILSVVMWFILAAGVMNLQRGYVAVLSDDSIVMGMQSISSMHYLSPLFLVLGIVSLLFLLVFIVLPHLSGKTSKLM
jgi:hypothetical protein